MKAKLLNSDASLNDFSEVNSIEYVPGENLKVVIRLFNSHSGVRYVPPIASEVTLTFVDEDGDNVYKVAAVLDSDDRSMWFVELSQAETLALGSANITVKLDEEGDGDPIYLALIANGLIRTSITGDC